MGNKLSANKNKLKFKQNEKIESVMENLFRVSEKYKISILPISSEYVLENLYPITDRVSEWNTFIIGNDKTYILSNIGDNEYLNFTEENCDIVDTRGNKLPLEIFEFFDKVWTHTLDGKNLQFYMVVKGVLYFINTYSLKNTNSKIIGAIMFMRNFDTLPKNEYNKPIEHVINIDTKKILETANRIIHKNDENSKKSN